MDAGVRRRFEGGRADGSARRSRPGRALVAVVLGILLAGCNGAASNSPATWSPSARTETAAPSATPTVQPPAPSATPIATDVPRPRIGIALPTKTTGRWLLDSAGLVERLTSLGYEPDLRVAEDDPAVQLDQVRGMIRDGAVALVIAPVDGVDLAADVAAASTAGIRTVAYDRLAGRPVSSGQGSGMTPPPVPAAYDLFVGFDFRQEGFLQANTIVDVLDLEHAAAPHTVELFADDPGDPASRDAFEAAMSVLRPWIEGGRLVVASDETGFDRAAFARSETADAQARLERLLTTVYAERRLDALLVPRDAMSRALIATLKGRGYFSPGNPGPVVTGGDAELPSIRSMLAGEQASTIFRDPRALAETAAQAVHALVTGAPVDFRGRTTVTVGGVQVEAILLVPLGVGPQDVQRVLVDSGYLDPELLK